MTTSNRRVKNAEKLSMQKAGRHFLITKSHQSKSHRNLYDDWDWSEHPDPLRNIIRQAFKKHYDEMSKKDDN